MLALRRILLASPLLLLARGAQAGNEQFNKSVRFRRVRNEPDHPGKRRDLHGRWWEIDEPHLNFEQFGAIGDGFADDTRAVRHCIVCADKQGRAIRAKSGTYRLTSSISLKISSQAFSITGEGYEATRLVLDHYSNGLILIGRKDRRPSVKLSDFSIGRNNSKFYSGRVGHKSLYIANGAGVKVSNVEEYGAIGFGITIENCINYEISRCISRDHVGGSLHRSGTDGIHIYRCAGPGRVFENYISNVGDDAISFGSIDPSIKTQNFECFRNIVSDTSGSIKVYGNAGFANIYENSLTRCETGGVTLWDDRNSGQSFDISNINIHSNRMYDCGGAGAAGGVFLTQPAGDATQVIRNISITENLIVNCRYGITAISNAANKSNHNIAIRKNTIIETTHTAIQVNSASGRCNISHNTIERSGFGDILVYKPKSNCDLEITSNIILFSRAKSSGSGKSISIRDRRKFRNIIVQES